MLYKATDTELTVVADAIRRKDGTESPLTFPAEYIAHIEAIVTGDDGKSAILVHIDTGSTVTVTGGGQTYTAQEENGLWLFPKLAPGTYTAQATKGGMTASQTITIPDDYSRRFVYYVEMSYRSVPVFTYTGSYEIVQDDDTAITNPETYTGNWKIRFLTSGTLTMQNLCGARNGIDVFLVGGGGGASANYGAGGGGGYTRTLRQYIPIINYNFPITVGSGGGGISGWGTASQGGTSSAFGFDAAGGYGSSSSSNGGNGGGNGGSGGAGCNNGTGGSDGGNGTNGQYSKGGAGQGSTTREFGEAGAKLYGGGGGSEKNNGGAGGGGNPGYDGTVNTGGGAGSKGKAGGSGIVIIRNTR